MIRKGNKHNVRANGNILVHYCTTLFLFPFLIRLLFPIPACMDLWIQKPPPFQRYSPVTVYTERRRDIVYKRFLFVYQIQDHNSAIIKFMVIYRLISHELFGMTPSGPLYCLLHMTRLKKITAIQAMTPRVFHREADSLL